MAKSTSAAIKRLQTDANTYLPLFSITWAFFLSGKAFYSFFRRSCISSFSSVASGMAMIRSKILPLIIVFIVSAKKLVDDLRDPKPHFSYLIRSINSTLPSHALGAIGRPDINIVFARLCFEIKLGVISCLCRSAEPPVSLKADSPSTTVSLRQ